MMTLENLRLLSLQPEFLQTDPVTAALCRALDPIFWQLAAQLRGLLLYTHVDELPGELLDELAWGWEIDWYNPEGTLEERRATVKSAFSVFRRRGTAYALRTAVEAGFGAARVEEWFDYGGEPYHFRIVVEDPTVTTSRAVAFLSTVERVKNVRSVLDNIIISNTSPGPCWLGAASVMTKRIRSEAIV